MIGVSVSEKTKIGWENTRINPINDEPLLKAFKEGFRQGHPTPRYSVSLPKKYSVSVPWNRLKNRGIYINDIVKIRVSVSRTLQ